MTDNDIESVWLTQVAVMMCFPLNEVDPHQPAT